MSARDYFHEKAEESRHNELIGYVMFLAGSVFFVGGILAALTVNSQPSWFLFIPYDLTSIQALALELSFLVVGLFLIVVGIASGLHFYRDRSMYMQELFKAKDSDDLLRDFRAQTATVKRNNKT
jgi:uncharacterized membrane protein